MGGGSGNGGGRRVVATGIGIVSPLGLDSERHWDRLVAGDSAVDACRRAQCASLPAHLEASVADFDAREHVPDRVLRKLLSPSAVFPVAAAGEALRQAGIDAADEQLIRCGLYVGSISFDVLPETFIPALKESLDQDGNFEMARFARRGMKLLDPLFLVKALPNGGLGGISIQYQILGPNANITNGPLSGLQAVAAAAAAIRRGEVDLALAGGYDSLVRVDSVVEHLLSGRLSTGSSASSLSCRPFDLVRNGFAVGEGAAFVMLEEESYARKRSALVYGEVAAASQTSDGRLLDAQANRDGDALAAAARQALQKAGRGPEEMDAIFGDGLATMDDDQCEGAVVDELIGDHRIPFTAATGAIGFTGAASGVFSIAHGLLALRSQVIPPLTNCERLDPLCSVRTVSTGQPRCVKRVLVWQSDRGMKNIAIVLGAGDG